MVLCKRQLSIRWLQNRHTWQYLSAFQNFWLFNVLSLEFLSRLGLLSQIAYNTAATAFLRLLLAPRLERHFIPMQKQCLKPLNLDCVSEKRVCRKHLTWQLISNPGSTTCRLELAQRPLTKYSLKLRLRLYVALSKRVLLQRPPKVRCHCSLSLADWTFVTKGFGRYMVRRVCR